MSKFSDFLDKKKIDSRRLLAASKQLENLRQEDRVIKLAHKKARGGDDKAKETAAQKRRSGRALSGPTLRKALGGGTLGSGGRSRVLRAVNRVLEQKKQGAVTAADLF